MRCTYIQSFGFNELICRQKTVTVGKIFTLVLGGTHFVVNKFIFNPFIYKGLLFFWLVVRRGQYGIIIAVIRAR